MHVRIHECAHTRVCKLAREYNRLRPRVLVLGAQQGRPPLHQRPIVRRQLQPRRTVRLRRPPSPRLQLRPRRVDALALRPVRGRGGLRLGVDFLRKAQPFKPLKSIGFEA